MSISSDDVKNIAEVASPFILPFYKALIAPKVEAFKKHINKGEIDDQLIENLFESKFSTYLKLKFEEFNSMNVLAFPNQQIKTKDIYFPLELLSTKDAKTHRIFKNTHSFIDKYKKILISDSAGMGKSTLAKWIALDTIENNKSIPILISLRDLSDTHLVLDEISRQLDGLEKTISRDLFIKFLNLGDFTILLDGLDEVSDSFAHIVIKDIKELVALAPNNNYILTSRPENSLSSFGEFQGFKIRPLEIEEAYEIIKIYDKLNENNSVSETLIEDISNNLNQVREFLINPFLTSLLYRTYTYNKDIPSKKCTFYEDVISALYKTHDLSKNKYKRNKATSLDEYDLRQLLRELARLTFKIGTVYTELEFVDLLKSCKKNCPNLVFKESDLLYDLECNVPVFCREGNKIRWAHKSLQDYFLACYISNSASKEQMMQNLYVKKIDTLLTVVDFLFELEPTLFRTKILLPFLNDFIYYCDNTYTSFSKINHFEIRKRQAVNYLNPFFLYIGKMEPNVFFDIDSVLPPDFNRRLSIQGSRGKFSYTEVFEETYQNQLAGILSFRNLPIFSDLNPKSRIDLTDLVKASEQKNGTSFYLTDEPNNEFNSPKHFSKVTDSLFVALNFRHENSAEKDIRYLDYYMCKNLVSEINKSCQNQPDEDII